MYEDSPYYCFHEKLYHLGVFSYGLRVGKCNFGFYMDWKEWVWSIFHTGVTEQFSLLLFNCFNSYWFASCTFCLTLPKRTLSNAASLPTPNAFVKTTQKKSELNWEEEYQSGYSKSWDERLNLSQLEKVTNCEERKPKSTHTLQERILFLVLT